jgi:hypothetical protein
MRHGEDEGEKGGEPVFMLMDKRRCGCGGNPSALGMASFAVLTLAQLNANLDALKGDDGPSGIEPEDVQEFRDWAGSHPAADFVEVETSESIADFSDCCAVLQGEGFKAKWAAVLEWMFAAPATAAGRAPIRDVTHIIFVVDNW